MQQDGGASAKQQIVERIKQSTNILVTVSSNPSVDALSAALALTLMLTKLDKHVTAVFSGTIPPAIKFLQPDKTFEHDVDSLRDFIIALDKEKADRLRYKVENDVVKIFITPYKTTITEKDLQFSQGDFNVDLIIALGVEKREELDRAITAHGRILHDATVATINAANQKSSLGSVDWQEGAASSLCEMLMSLSEALQAGLLDQQISTALLTGIVAATERFSNHQTTPRVMTMSAQLMAAGANQQLIATNLGAAVVAANRAGAPPEASAKVKAAANGEMHIKHDTQEVRPEVTASAPPMLAQPASPNEPTITPSAAQAFNDLKQALETESKSAVKPAAPTENTRNATQAKAPEPKEKDEESYLNKKPSWMGRNIEPPTLGGSLSATAQEALEDKIHEEEDQRNHKILSHDQPKNKTGSKFNRPQPKPQNSQTPQNPSAPPTPPPTPEPMPQPAQPMPDQSAAQPIANGSPLMDSVSLQTEPTLEQLEQQAKGAPVSSLPAQPGDLDAARQAVSDALATGPFTPIGNRMESIGAQDFPQTPQTTPDQIASQQLPVTPPPALAALPPLQPQPAPQLPTAQSDIAQSAPPLPPVPPLPDFNTLPPAPPVLPQLPPLPESQPEQSPPPPTPQQPPQPTDPGQFKIPGQ